MGYAVLHLEKAKGADTGMSAHIERTIHPKNADESRTHLNKELIEFPDGIHSRSEAISHRINTAGITRKIGFKFRLMILFGVSKGASPLLIGHF